MVSRKASQRSINQREWRVAKRLVDSFFCLERRKMTDIYFKKLDPRAKIPQYSTPGSSGMDLHIILDEEDDQVQPGEVKIFRTGFAIEMPKNTEAQIRPRSGLSLQYPNYIANSPATIDESFRGEIKIIFVNNSERTAIIKNKMRLAQIIFSKVIQASIKETNILSNTLRGSGGFGHTGN